MMGDEEVMGEEEEGKGKEDLSEMENITRG